jgi:hypothetical protein
MTPEECRTEIQEYVRHLETTYNQKITSLKNQISNGRKQLRTVMNRDVGEKEERNDLEELFI